MAEEVEESLLDITTALTTIGVEFLSLTHEGAMSELTPLDIAAAQADAQAARGTVQTSPLLARATQV